MIKAGYTACNKLTPAKPEDQAGMNAAAMAAPAAATGPTTPGFVQPNPAICGPTTFGGWTNTRVDGCWVGKGDVTVADGDGKLVGEMTYGVLDYAYYPVPKSAYSGTSKSTFGDQVQIKTFTTDGVTVGSTIHGVATCEGTCPIVSTKFDDAPMVIDQIVGGYAFVKHVVTPGQALTGAVDLNWFFTNPSWAVPSPTVGLSAPWFRCDQAVPGNNKTIGCVVKDFIPTYAYSRALFPDLANHIDQAQSSGLPGNVITGPLNRNTDPANFDANRKVACGGRPNPGPGPDGVKRSCDEYPFAATNQGAATPNGSGGARTWDGCGVTLPGPNSTGPTGYSVCFVNASQNSTGGSWLNSKFFVPNRVLDGDAYYVTTTA